MKQKIPTHRNAAVPNDGKLAWGWTESERQSQDQNQRREEDQFPKAAFPIAPPQVKIVASSTELANGQKAIQAYVHEKQFIQGAQSVGPSRVEPAQIDSETQHQQNDGIPPVAALLRIGGDGLSEQPCNDDRQPYVECEPSPSKDVMGSRNQDVW